MTEARSLLVGADGPGVVVSARVARILVRPLLDAARRARDNGEHLDAELVRTLDALRLAGAAWEPGRNEVRAGQDGSALDLVAGVPDTEPVLLLTYGRTALRLDVSLSTVKRLVDAGELPVVRVGSSPRIRASDLDTYVASLEPARGGAA